MTPLASVILELLHQPYFALFAMIGLGLALGNIRIGGVTLGSSGVIFLALLFGHLGAEIPGGTGSFGLILFVYCVGIGAGSRFFAVFREQGSKLAQLSLIIVGSGALVAGLAAWWLNLPAGLAAGLFAGAMTSTPALAAASEAVTPLAASEVPVGYGIAYPIGVIGVVIFVQLLPRWLKADLNAIHAEGTKDQTANEVINSLVEVTNPNLYGKQISESGLMNLTAARISRVKRGERLVPLTYEDRFEEGQCLLLVGRAKEIQIAVEYLGKPSNQPVIKDVENERRILLATERKVLGRTLREMAPLKNFNVSVTRVMRLGLTFVPDENTIIENYDQLTVVGQPDDLRLFGEHIGHRSSDFDKTDLLSLALGLSLGVLVGIIPIALPGGEPFRLGLAGGPLLVAIILGQLGRVGGIVGYIPRPTRLLLQELGLVLFLADAGVKGGAALWETVQTHGLTVFAAGALVTIIPLLIAVPVSLKLLRVNLLQALGGICGGMTSTPALGAITAKTDSEIPVISYAAAYPAALILMTLLAKALVGILG